ncbi:Hydroxyneurosporene dehydrogenase [Cytospora mali]|uniref:Hydroxyneurosporene dehydrogenase n=1 Tax=Cytospora mali TaxID=578113 RepID=A0A194WA54_CYTMA|nr:Hydroxyneurosporene dehydrogenase [Valsa mali]
MKGLTTAVLPLLIRSALAEVTTLSDDLSTESVTAEWTSSYSSYLDGAKLSGPANDTSYDWWYFDAVSASTNASVVVVFYNSGPDGFINTYEGGPLSVSITGTFPNGTQYSLETPATGAVITTGSNGISLDFEGSGFGFVGSDIRGSEVTYVMTIDSPDIGVQGTVTWTSVAPAHYPCDLNKAGVTELILPHVGWANAVPDATAAVSLSFGDSSTVSFTDGVGYHDKNWGDRPFVESASQWYWGHAHLGPYSLVWFDALDITGQEYFSGYVAQDGKVLEASCVSGAVVVRPWGANSTYPPTLTTGPMQGLELEFDLGHGKTLAANVTTGGILVQTTGYLRTIGTIEGGIKGGESYSGRALFEEFALIE